MLRISTVVLRLPMSYSRGSACCSGRVFASKILVVFQIETASSACWGAWPHMKSLRDSLQKYKEASIFEAANERMPIELRDRT